MRIPHHIIAKIIKLIDELIASLKNKQRDDTSKKEWCKAEIDKIEDNKKVLKNKISDSEDAYRQRQGEHHDSQD